MTKILFESKLSLGLCLTNANWYITAKPQQYDLKKSKLLPNLVLLSPPSTMRFIFSGAILVLLYSCKFAASVTQQLPPQSVVGKSTLSFQVGIVDQEHPAC